MKKIIRRIFSKDNIVEFAKKTYKKSRRLTYKIKGTFTIKNLCKRFDVEVPDKLKGIQNIRCGFITWDDSEIEEGCIFFAQYGYSSNEEWYKKIMKKKPAAIFIPKSYYDNYIPKGDYPVIPVDNLFEKQGELIASIAKRRKTKYLAITGSIGKTTTKQLLNCVLSKEGLTFCHQGNLNTFRSVSDNLLYKVNNLFKYYIQEVAAFSPHAVERSAQMLRPDAYILTNIYPHHLNTYKTKENVLIDKASLSKYINKGGVAVVNYDDDLIANYDFGHQIITFGINTKREVDYRGVNIVQNNEFLELDIEHNGEIVTHLKVQVVGKHNAYNILGVYALCKWLGIKDDHIRKNILNFKATGIRQNIRNIGGVNFYLDCYNCSFDSIRADISTLEDMVISKENKKIAILAPENKLGKNYKEKIYEFGKTFKNPKVDYIICYSRDASTFPFDEDYYGMNSEPLYRGIKDAGFKNVFYIDNHDDLVKKIKELCNPGDIVLVKANFELYITMAIDEVYGSTITFDNEINPDRYDIVEDNGYRMNVSRDFKTGLLLKYSGNDDKELTIPDKVEGCPVFGVSRRVFSERKSLEKINFGKSVKNLGVSSFARNKGIKQLHIPSNVKWISAYAFSNCSNLTKVVIDEGLVNISKFAFLNCTSLTEIEIPKSVKVIEPDAFKGIEGLTIIGLKGSTAQKYAEEFRIKFKEKK